MNLGEEFERIPVAAQILAAGVVLGSAVLLSWFFSGSHFAVALMFFGALAGAVLAAFILLAGYVYADARRRGMPAAVWTALTLLVPNGVGFVLYFLLRKPLAHPCPNCGRSVAVDFVFCPACGQPQTTASVPRP